MEGFRVHGMCAIYIYIYNTDIYCMRITKLIKIGFSVFFLRALFRLQSLWV